MSDDLGQRLWTNQSRSSGGAAMSAAEYGALVEQYKIYVEMADRVSSRRSVTNTFFLTLNSAAFTVVGLFLSRVEPVSASRGWLTLPLLALCIQCLAWFWLLRSYRQLNSAKFQVIGALEERLPASPYWRAEWFALGEGRDKRKYWPLTHLEQWVPLLFLGIYVGGFMVAMLG